MLRAKAVLVFVLRSIFSKTGLAGLALVLLKPLWNVFAAWQAVDFLAEHMTPLFDFLNGFWGPFVLMVIGFALIIKAVYSQWPETHADGEQTKQLRTENKQLREVLENLAESKPTGTHGRGILTAEYPEPPTGTEQLKEENERLAKEIERLKAQAPQPNDEDLRQRCCELAAEIFEFYRRQRQNMDDSLQSEHWDRISDVSVREQKRADEIARHDRWIIDQYGREFGSKMLTLSNDLAQAQAITPEDRNAFENPKKPQDIQYIAQRLEAICGRPESSTGMQATAAAKRKAVKDLLGKAMQEGQGLRSSHKQERNEKRPAARDWVRRTYDLIEAAFDTAEAQYFRGSEIDSGLDPVDGCLSRLEQLMARANFLDVNPDFDPEPYQELFVCD